jgi:hypothetical protein
MYQIAVDVSILPQAVTAVIEQVCRRHGGHRDDDDALC